MILFPPGYNETWKHTTFSYLKFHLFGNSTRTHGRTHGRTHAHAHAQYIYIYIIYIINIYILYILYVYMCVDIDRYTEGQRDHRSYSFFQRISIIPSTCRILILTFVFSNTEKFGKDWWWHVNRRKLVATEHRNERVFVFFLHLAQAPIIRFPVQKVLYYKWTDVSIIKIMTHQYHLNL